MRRTARGLSKRKLLEDDAREGVHAQVQVRALRNPLRAEHLLHANDSPDDSDSALMARVRAGDPLAYRKVSARYLTRVLNLSYRLLGDAGEAEDVTQETFLKFWTERQKFREEQKLLAWLFRVAKNLSLDRLRARRPAGDIDGLVDSARPSRSLERKQLALSVSAAVAELPERQKVALIMSHWDGLGNPEIAEILESTVEAVESLLSRARRTLRQQLAPPKEQPL